jgi:branched-chain amino acid aminotransferase
MSKTFPYSYIRGKICKTAKATIPIQSKAVQYGLGIFSGIRGHWNKKDKELYLFRLKDHYKRLKQGAKITGMKFRYSYTEFEKTIISLIKKNKAKEDIYLRINLYAASTKLTPRFDNEDDDLAIYMISLKDYFNSSEGLDVMISTWRKFDDNAISTKAKITGAYANSALAKTEAIQNGYHEAILLNRDKTVSEATGANIFAVKGNALITPPLSANNLEGITRKTVMELAIKELKIKVTEKNIRAEQLPKFDELFFSGTAAKIAWIQSVNKKKVNIGKEGLITQELKYLFAAITKGELSRYKKWLTPVYQS